MAKEKSVLDEIKKLQDQIESKKQEALAELANDLQEAKQVVKDIERQMEELSGKGRKQRSQEKGRVCTVCGEPGHNARRHSKNERAAAKKKAAEE